MTTPIRTQQPTAMPNKMPASFLIYTDVNVKEFWKEMTHLVTRYRSPYFSTILATSTWQPSPLCQPLRQAGQGVGWTGSSLKMWMLHPCVCVCVADSLWCRTMRYYANPSSHPHCSLIGPGTLYYLYLYLSVYVYLHLYVWSYMMQGPRQWHRLPICFNFWFDK